MGDNVDRVASWLVPMSNNIYKIEFCHGTITGKRILRINGKEILRRDWMFKLVGRECFELNDVKCAIIIEAIGIFAYEYSLKVGGKTFEKFREEQERALQVWHLRLGNKAHTSADNAVDASNNDVDDFKRDVRICLEKNTMDVWVNGTKANTTGEFVESGGTRTHFEVYASNDAEPKCDDNQRIHLATCYIETESSGRRNVGILHKLYVDGIYVLPVNTDGIFS